MIVLGILLLSFDIQKLAAAEKRGLNYEPL